MTVKDTGIILVVDDQENWRKVLITLLQEEGYAVCTASCFEEAMDAITKNIFDLVVFDIRLVDDNTRNVQGIELLEFVKSQPTPPKAIMLTGYPESVNEGVLEKHGADALALKVPPESEFNSEEFIKKVKRLLQA